VPILKYNILATFKVTAGLHFPDTVYIFSALWFALFYACGRENNDDKMMILTNNDYNVITAT